MNATQTTAADAASNADTSHDFTALDANNFIRGQPGACLIITNNSQAEPIETVFLSINRTYFRIDQFGPTLSSRVSKVERHTMSAALETARQNGHDTRLAAYQQSSLDDIRAAILFIRSNFEIDDKDSKAGFGLSRDDLDDHSEDDNLEIAAAPADTSEEHGGGW